MKNSTVPTLEIDRTAATSLLEHQTTDLNMSLTAQVAKEFRKATLKFQEGGFDENFRAEKNPFVIHYRGEAGLDAGGLTRDMFTQIYKELHNPNIGLFIPVPNARNNIGGFQDCFIPSPDSELPDQYEKYWTVGVLLAIGVRTGIVQAYSFPNLFWDVLAGKQITESHLFEIDELYKKQIQEYRKITDPDQFEEQFPDLEQTQDHRGNFVSVTNGQKVTPENVSWFISQAHQVRINELMNPLKIIRDGFWGNLGFSCPEFVTGSLLEKVCCAEKNIATEDIKERTNIEPESEKNSEVINLFWQMVDGFNMEHKQQLLQFWTGSLSVPQNKDKFKITVLPPSENLPCAHTCFYALEIPQYPDIKTLTNKFMIALASMGDGFMVE